MPTRPADFTLTLDQRTRVRCALAAWDARDPWSPHPHLERQLQELLASIVAPRIVSMPSAVHAAKFLRELIERSDASPPAPNPPPGA